jgi:AcrR family transcriptional regulator
MLGWGVAKTRDTEQRSYHHGNLSETLVKSALEIIGSEGLGSLSLRALARHAGVSPAAPYRHFPSRDALLEAIAAQGFRLRSEAMRSAMQAAGSDPMARLLEVGVAFVLFATDHSSHYSVMTSAQLIEDSKDLELAEAGAESMGILLQAMRDGQEAGQIAGGDLKVLAAAAWASVHGLASLIASGQLRHLRIESENVEELTRRITRAMLGTMEG